MRRREAGMTLIEVLVVVAILATLAGMVSLLIPQSKERENEITCISNVRQIVGLMEADDTYPRRGGPAMILYFVRRGDIAGRDELQSLFCRGDTQESLELAGGEEAYQDLDLKADDLGHLTSYAGRDQERKQCRVRHGHRPPAVLIADDSGDHHRRGIVVGLTGGAAKLRRKFDDYGLDNEASVEVGAGSSIAELDCLRAD